MGAVPLPSLMCACVLRALAWGHSTEPRATARELRRRAPRWRHPSSVACVLCLREPCRRPGFACAHVAVRHLCGAISSPTHVYVVGLVAAGGCSNNHGGRRNRGMAYGRPLVLLEGKWFSAVLDERLKGHQTLVGLHVQAAQRALCGVGPSWGPYGLHCARVE